jgi:hypothetical protein
MVYPGTESYRQAKDLGYISTEDYSNWLTDDGLHNSVVNLPGITHRELVEFCDKARRKFYLSPSYLLHKVFQSFKDPRELQRNLKGFATLSKYLLRGSFGNGANNELHSAKDARPREA